MNQETQSTLNFWQKPYVWYGLVLDLIILDQISKYAIREWLDLPIVLIPDWLQIVFVENKGIAFSLPVPGGLSSVIAVVVSLYLGWQLWVKQFSTTMRLSYALIMAGALGNLIDRFWLGAVTDFISVSTFPVFNLADSFICIGVALLIWHEVTSG